MNRPVIIGFGNTLRGDDGAGVHVAQRVAAEIGGVDVVTVQELTPELAPSLTGRDLVIFVDASTRVPHLSVGAVEPAAEPLRHADHALLPADIVSLCGGLFPPAPRSALLIEVPAFNYAFGETLTPAADRMVELSVEMIRDLLAGNLAAGAPGLPAAESLPH